MTGVIAIGVGPFHAVRVIRQSADHVEVLAIDGIAGVGDGGGQVALARPDAGRGIVSVHFRGDVERKCLVIKPTQGVELAVNRGGLTFEPANGRILQCWSSS